MTSRFAPIEPVPQTTYQVDYVAVNCGKIVAASKRRIRFKFGYTNMDALNSGQSGQDCRGAEHEIVVTWSLSSGKQAIAFDQHEVYFDVGDPSQTKIAHAFKDRDGHMIEVKIHAANMSAKSNPPPDWKQYDILVDGVSFFRMPKIYEIGIAPKEDPSSFKLQPKFAQYSSSSRRESSPTLGSILPPEEPKQPDPAPPAVADLLSFDDFDAPAVTPQAAPVQAVPQIQQQVYAQPPQNAPTYAQPPQTAPTYDTYVNPTQNQVAPAPTYNQYAAPENPFNQQPSQNGYTNNTFPPTGSPVATQDPAAYYVAPTPSTNTYSYDLAQPNPVTPQEEPSTALVPAQTAPAARDDNGVVKNLVDLDNLFGTSTAAAPATKHSDAHKSLGQLHGSNVRKANQPIMNPFNAAPVYQQQPQQPQQMYSGYAAAQQPQHQQPQYNNFSQQQKQQYAQPGFGY